MAASREFEITLTAYPGGGAPKSGQTSVMLETEIDLPYPRKPQRRRGLWAFLTRANTKAETKWAEDVANWHRTGGKGARRIYLPNASINLNEENGTA